MSDCVSVTSISFYKKHGLCLHTIIMPPTSKKLEGNIASGLFVRPSVTLFDALHNFRTVNAILKFLMKKKLIRIFFSRQDYAPFLSYGPLKKYGCNLVSKISQKLLKLEP